MAKLRALFKSYKRLFGQCDVCIKRLEVMECSLACDADNSRFYDLTRNKTALHNVRRQRRAR